MEEKFETIKKHERDFGALLKEVKAFQKALTILQQQQSKIAQELISLGGKISNEWGKGFLAVGNVFTEIETFITNLNESIQENFVNPLSQKLTQDSKMFSVVEKKVFKKKGDKSEHKPEEVVQVINYIDEEHCNSCFKLWFQVVKAESDMFSKCKAKTDELLNTFGQLEKKQIPRDHIIPLLNLFGVNHATNGEEPDSPDSNPKKRAGRQRSASLTIGIAGSLRRRSGRETTTNKEPDKPAIPEGGILCRALFDYTAEREDELDLKAGQLIVVLKKPDDEWWVGLANTKRGLFPATFVETVEDEEAQFLHDSFEFKKDSPKNEVTRSRTQATF